MSYDKVLDQIAQESEREIPELDREALVDDLTEKLEKGVQALFDKVQQYATQRGGEYQITNDEGFYQKGEDGNTEYFTRFAYNLPVLVACYGEHPWEHGTFLMLPQSFIDSVTFDDVKDVLYNAGCAPYGEFIYETDSLENVLDLVKYDGVRSIYVVSAQLEKFISIEDLADLFVENDSKGVDVVRALKTSLDFVNETLEKEKARVGAAKELDFGKENLNDN